MLIDKMTPEQRKEHPVATGVLAYFPQAILAVAHCSYVGNEQHNPGSELHWDRAKSQDELDAGIRHAMKELTDFASLDSDGVFHIVKTCWRMLAYTEKMLEKIEAEAVERISPEEEFALVERVTRETEECASCETLAECSEAQVCQQAMAAVKSSRDFIQAQREAGQAEALAAHALKEAAQLDGQLEAHLRERAEKNGINIDDARFIITPPNVGHLGVGEGDAGLPPASEG